MSKYDRETLEAIAVDMVVNDMQNIHEQDLERRAWKDVKTLSDEDLIMFITE